MTDARRQVLARLPSIEWFQVSDDPTGVRRVSYARYSTDYGLVQLECRLKYRPVSNTPLKSVRAQTLELGTAASARRQDHPCHLIGLLTQHHCIVTTAVGFAAHVKFLWRVFGWREAALQRSNPSLGRQR